MSTKKGVAMTASLKKVGGLLYIYFPGLTGPNTHTHTHTHTHSPPTDYGHSSRHSVCVFIKLFANFFPFDCLPACLSITGVVSGWQGRLSINLAHNGFSQKVLCWNLQGTGDFNLQISLLRALWRGFDVISITHSLGFLHETFSWSDFWNNDHV